MKRIIAVFTIACYLFSFIFSQPLAAAAGSRAAAAQMESALDEFFIPYSIGRITDARYFDSSKKIVVAIQDLHCHAQTQENISKIIGLIDEKYGLDTVFVEGASGKVDTSWLADAPDLQVKERLSRALLEQGTLTGAEYYSISSARPRLLSGLEDEKLYNENVSRLNSLLGRQYEIKTLLDGLKINVEAIKKTHYNRLQRRIQTITAKNKSGKLSAEKYYALLAKTASGLGMEPGSYPAMEQFIELSALQQKISYKKSAAQLQKIMQELKGRLVYGAWQKLSEITDNFKKQPELYIYLSRIAALYNIPLKENYPQLAVFFDYIDRSQNLNPLELEREERALLRRMNMAAAENAGQKAAAFIAGFFEILSNFCSSNITAEDYRWFVSNRDLFFKLWPRYAGSDMPGELNDIIGQYTRFYETNIERNRRFVHCAGLSAAPLENPPDLLVTPRVNHVRCTAKALGRGTEAVVMVTGGFHTSGLAELFKENSISYIVVTPNITVGASSAAHIYRELISRQGEITGKAAAMLALYNLSKQLNDPSFRMQSLEHILSAFTNEELAKLSTRDTSSAAAYAEKHLSALFDNKKTLSSDEFLSVFKSITGEWNANFGEKLGTLVFVPGRLDKNCFYFTLVFQQDNRQLPFVYENNGVRFAEVTVKPALSKEQPPESSNPLHNDGALSPGICQLQSVGFADDGVVTQDKQMACMESPVAFEIEFRAPRELTDNGFFRKLGVKDDYHPKAGSYNETPFDPSWSADAQLSLLQALLKNGVSADDIISIQMNAGVPSDIPRWVLRWDSLDLMLAGVLAYVSDERIYNKKSAKVSQIRDGRNANKPMPVKVNGKKAERRYSHRVEYGFMDLTNIAVMAPAMQYVHYLICSHSSDPGLEAIYREHFVPLKEYLKSFDFAPDGKFKIENAESYDKIPQWRNGHPEETKEIKEMLEAAATAVKLHLDRSTPGPGSKPSWILGSVIRIGSIALAVVLGYSALAVASPAGAVFTQPGTGINLSTFLPGVVPVIMSFSVGIFILVSTWVFKAQRLPLSIKPDEIPPVENLLISADQAAYCMEYRSIINPDGDPLKVMYGASGPDLTTVLLNFDPAEVICVDIVPVSLTTLKKLIERDKNPQETDSEVGQAIAFRLKNSFWNIYQVDEYMTELIVVELRALGVKKEDIHRIESENGSVTLEFNWAYPGRGNKKLRKIKFLESDIIKIKDFQQADYYYQKSALTLTNRLNSYINRIAASVKRGILLSPIRPEMSGDIINEDWDMITAKWRRGYNGCRFVPRGGGINQFYELSLGKKNEVYNWYVELWQKELPKKAVNALTLPGAVKAGSFACAFVLGYSALSHAAAPDVLAGGYPDSVTYVLETIRLLIIPAVFTVMVAIATPPVKPSPAPDYEPVLPGQEYNALSGTKGFMPLLKKMNTASMRKLAISTAEMNEKFDIDYETHRNFIKNLGRKRGLKGPFVYYPFGGADVLHPFTEIPDATDVFTFGMESFYGPLETRDSMKERGYLDIGEITWDMGSTLSIYKKIGSLIIKRIMYFLNAEVTGIYYFQFDENGNIVFVLPQDVNEQNYHNAVVGFKTREDGKIKRFWYLRHDINKDEDNFPKFIGRLRFQTLYIKAAYWIFRQRFHNRLNSIRRILLPAKANKARVGTDQILRNRDVSEPSGPYPMWREDYRPGEIQLAEYEIFGNSRGPDEFQLKEEGDYVYFGDAEGLIDEKTPLHEILNYIDLFGMLTIVLAVVGLIFVDFGTIISAHAGISHAAAPDVLAGSHAIVNSHAEAGQSILNILSRLIFPGLAAVVVGIIAAGGGKETVSNLSFETRELRKKIDKHAMRLHNFVFIEEFLNKVSEINNSRENKIDIDGFIKALKLYQNILGEAKKYFNTPQGEEKGRQLDSLSDKVLKELSKVRGQLSENDADLLAVTDEIYSIMTDGRELSVVDNKALEQLFNRVMSPHKTEYHWHKEKSAILASPVMLERVISNLEKNSGRAIMEYELSLLKQGKSHDEISKLDMSRTIHVTEDDKDWIVTYSDKGPGIPGELLKDNKLFEPAVTSKDDGLSGYGLAICKDMVEAMRGTISVESEKGRGAAFTIRLPKLPQPGNSGKNINKAELFDLFGEIAESFGKHDSQKIFYERNYFSIFDKPLGSAIMEKKCGKLAALLSDIGQDLCVIHNTNQLASETIREQGIKPSFKKLWSVIYDFKNPRSINERFNDVVKIVRVGSNKYGQVNKRDIIAQVISDKDKYLLQHKDGSLIKRGVSKDGNYVVCNNYTEAVKPILDVNLSLSFELESLIDLYISEYLDTRGFYKTGDLVRRGLAAEHLKQAAIMHIWIDRLSAGIEKYKNNNNLAPGGASEHNKTAAAGLIGQYKPAADFSFELKRNRKHQQRELAEMVEVMVGHGVPARVIAAKLSEAVKNNLEILFNEGRAMFAKHKGIPADEINSGFVLAGSFARGDCALYSDVEFSVIGDGKREIEAYIKNNLKSMGFDKVDTYYYTHYAPGAYINAYWYGGSPVVSGLRDMYMKNMSRESFIEEHKDRIMSYLDRAEFDAPVDIMRPVQFFVDLIKIKYGMYNKINIFEILDEIEFKGIIPKQDVQAIEKFYENMAAMRLSGKIRLDEGDYEKSGYAVVSSIIAKYMPDLENQADTPFSGSNTASIPNILRLADTRRIVSGVVIQSFIDRLVVNIWRGARKNNAGFFDENAAETADIFENEALAPEIRSTLAGAAARMAKDGTLMRRRPLVYETLDISQVTVTDALLHDYIETHRALGVDTFVLANQSEMSRAAAVISSLVKRYARAARHGAMPMPALHADYRIENGCSQEIIKQESVALVKAGAVGVRFDLSGVDNRADTESFTRPFAGLVFALRSENPDIVIAIIPPVLSDCKELVDSLISENKGVRRVVRCLPGRQPKNVPAGAFVEICLDEYVQDGAKVVRQEYEFEALNEEAFKEEIRSLLQNPDADAVGLSAGVMAGASRAGFAAPGSEKFDIAEFFAGLVRERRIKFMQTPEGMYAQGRGIAVNLAENKIPDISAFQREWGSLVRFYDENGETNEFIEQARGLAEQIDGRKYAAAIHFINRRIAQAKQSSDTESRKLYAASLAGFMEGVLEARFAAAAAKNAANSVIVPTLIHAIRGAA